MVTVTGLFSFLCTIFRCHYVNGTLTNCKFLGAVKTKVKAFFHLFPYRKSLNLLSSTHMLSTSKMSVIH